ncbi:MAG: restriction endonuclease [Bacteroidetes bacterium]|nr:restriction endonuclease [Bacteroidota bacterium]
MPNLFVVRSNYGQYTPQFIKGGYAAIGWLDEMDLSKIKTREELYPIYEEYHKEKNSLVLGQQVGQISRFLFEIQKGDYVIAQSVNSDHIHYGIVESDYYYELHSKDGCPYPHRKKVKWINELPRNSFSVPFQNTIRSSLTVFKVSQLQNFFSVIGETKFIAPKEGLIEYNYHKTILDRLMELDAKEFEILITHLLAALGFEGTEHTGRPGDGGVDATGELNIAGMAKVKIFVQAKRYKPDSTIKSSDVKALRQNIPRDGQGAFITTAQFDKKSKEVALDANFPRIGLINGNQFVELLAEHWDEIPNEFREKLGLKIGLIPM